MDGYDKLSFIDKIRFRWRTRHSNSTVNPQDIIDELLAERENKKNKVRSFPISEDKPIQTLPNTLEQYKISENVENLVSLETKRQEKRLEQILRKELNSEREVYDNIVELKTFISYPHDNIPDAENKVNEKLFYIQNILGKDVLDKGIQIYENDKALKEMYRTILVEDRFRMEQEILNNPTLSQQLNNLRYNPELSKKSTGQIVLYQAVFSKMVEESNLNTDKDKDSRDLGA